jgi:hypothetical protein
MVNMHKIVAVVLYDGRVQPLVLRSELSEVILMFFDDPSSGTSIRQPFQINSKELFD